MLQLKTRKMKTHHIMPLIVISIFLNSCGIKKDTAYEFDELYTGPGDTYISDYIAPSAVSKATDIPESIEDDYVSNADRTSASPWSQSGWGNSGYGSYNYGAYNQFNCGNSLMWMPYWAYSPSGFYSSPYAYYGYGMNYGGYGSAYYNPYYSPYYSPYGSGFWGNWDNSTSQVIHGSRQPIASNTGTNSSYTAGRFYLGQNRQAALQKPKPVMTTPKPNEKIPSGKAQENIARAYKRAETSNTRMYGNNARNDSQNPPRSSHTNQPVRDNRPVRDESPSRVERPGGNERPAVNNRQPDRVSVPARSSTPTRVQSPNKSGRP
jgi:hypothetical protein